MLKFGQIIKITLKLIKTIYNLIWDSLLTNKTFTA